MTTISSPVNPASFGFETGVVPSGLTYRRATAERALAIVEVASLPTVFQHGPTSPRALALPLPSGFSGSGYVKLGVHLEPTSVLTVKVAVPSGSSNDDVSVFGWPGTPSPLFLTGKDNWQTATITSDGQVHDYSFEIDFESGAGAANNTVWLTDFNVTKGGYFVLDTTSGTESPNAVHLSMSDRISALATRVATEFKNRAALEYQRADFATSSAQWSIVHSMGRVPNVALYATDGTQLITDVVATASAVTVTWANPTAGFAILS